MFLGKALEKAVEKEFDFALAFVEGGNLQRNDVETEVEILAELAFLDGLAEVAVGGGNDANIDVDGAVAADTFEFLFL